MPVAASPRQRPDLSSPLLCGSRQQVDIKTCAARSNGDSPAQCDSESERQIDKDESSLSPSQLGTQTLGQAQSPQTQEPHQYPATSPARKEGSGAEQQQHDSDPQAPICGTTWHEQDSKQPPSEAATGQDVSGLSASKQGAELSSSVQDPKVTSCSSSKPDSAEIEGTGAVCKPEANKKGQSEASTFPLPLSGKPANA